MTQDDLRLLHLVPDQTLHQRTHPLTVHRIQGIPGVLEDVEEQLDVVPVPVDHQVVQHVLAVHVLDAQVEQMPLDGRLAGQKPPDRVSTDNQ